IALESAFVPSDEGSQGELVASSSEIAAPPNEFQPVVNEPSPPPRSPLPDTNTAREDGTPGPVTGDVLTNDGAAGTLRVMSVDGVPVTANGNASVDGQYGTITLNADGTYSYFLNNSAPA